MALAINDSGKVLRDGPMSAGGRGPRRCCGQWSGKATKLGALLGSDRNYREAVGINNADDIVGNGDTNNGYSSVIMGFCLLPATVTAATHHRRLFGGRTLSFSNGQGWCWSSLLPASALLDIRGEPGGKLGAESLAKTNWARPKKPPRPPCLSTNVATGVRRRPPDRRPAPLGPGGPNARKRRRNSEKPR